MALVFIESLTTPQRTSLPGAGAPEKEVVCCSDIVAFWTDVCAARKLCQLTRAHVGRCPSRNYEEFRVRSRVSWLLSHKVNDEFDLVHDVSELLCTALMSWDTTTDLNLNRLDRMKAADIVRRCQLHPNAALWSLFYTRICRSGLSTRAQ